MDKVRLAIVGCGTISQLNAPGYLAHENCEVVALCDPVRERAEGRAREWGISPRIYTDYADVLNDSEVDAVELLTPTPLHPEQIISGLEAGKHVSCQKPTAGTLDEMRAIADAAGKADTFFRTTENFLYYPPIVKAQGTNSRRDLGRHLHGPNIRTLSGGGSESKIPIAEGAYVWRQDRERNLGGHMYDDGWHKVSTAMWWGGGVEKVSAIITRTDNFIQEIPSVATWKYTDKDCLAVFEYASRSARCPYALGTILRTSSWKS